MASIIEILMEEIDKEIISLEDSIKNNTREANKQERNNFSYCPIKEATVVISTSFSVRIADYRKAKEELVGFDEDKINNNLFSIVTLLDVKTDETLKYLLAPVLGGETITIGTEKIDVVSSSSPLGNELLNAEASTLEKENFVQLSKKLNGIRYKVLGIQKAVAK
ncbi:MAG: hypothetical protein FWD33_01335 [Alphaproteobacteria bacterium]|nr:hypothetical protein [Alphaproteobacteria bacterium]